MSFRSRRSSIFNRIAPHNPQTCPICLSTITTTRLAILSPCSHAYCTHCILKWSDVKRTCPLCNTTFDSWLHRFDFRKRRFDRFTPTPVNSESEGYGFRRPIRFGFARRREESRRLPRRREFRRSGLEERVHEWRASIYREKLRAVRLCLCSSSSRSYPPQSGLGSRDVEERIRRVSPWIRRELKAVLGDPDPTIIVHVVTSLYASSLQGDTSDSDFLAPLRPFLHGWTDMFWHELRCFAESSLTMETYDTVVNYERIGR